MIIQSRSVTRKGAVLPFVAICLVALIAMLALAIDIGVIAVARTQAQNAADASAMTGARTITGDPATNYNEAEVPVKAVTAAVANNILGGKVDADPGSITAVNDHTWKSKNVQIEIGSYAYLYNDANPSLEKFQVQFPRVDSTEPFSAVRSTVKGEGELSFARIFGLSTFNTSAVAVAAHRPRDVMIIIDLSGSMRFQSLPGVPMSGATANASSNSARTQSMNPESVFPRFGHYFDTATAALQGTSAMPTSTGEFVDPSNISVASNSGAPIIEDFHSNPVGTPASAGNRAFTRAPDSYQTTPGGDNYLKTNLDTTATYAKTVAQYNNNSTNINPAFELNGFKAVRPTFNGYTQGPGYWGKTFWMWPPAPGGSATLAPPASLTNTTTFNWHNNLSNDWRQRFFVGVNTSAANAPAWITHNTILYNTVGTSPVMKKPGDTTTVTENGASVVYTFRINYAAILYWLTNSNGVFPSTLQAGRIRYYTAIPNGSDKTLNNRWWTTNPTSLAVNERFWKEYIDFVLGYVATGANTYNNVLGSPISSLIGNGDYYTWAGSTLQISARPQPQPPSTTPNGPYQTGSLSAASPAGATTNIKLTAATKPTINTQFITIAGDTAHPYTITGVSGSSSPYTLTVTPALSAAAANGAAVQVYTQYMNYSDNVPRPRHQYWFGAMTMVDWLGNYNLPTLANSQPHHWWPGNCHEAQGWACKVGIQTAINDIEKNHPNDFVGLVFFSAPMTAQTGAGHHNKAVVPMGRNYQQLIDSLWFPPTTVTGGVAEIGPYDADMNQVPRADGGTAPGMGFMIAYNQFSNDVSHLRLYATPTTTYRGSAGGLGRKGAEHVIIFETDGSPNTRGYAGMAGSGTGSYYPIRVKNPANMGSTSNVEWPAAGTYANGEVYGVVQQIVALDTAATPGYSTARKTAKVYSIGYGSLFDPANASANQTTGLTFLQTVQFYGKTSTDTNPAHFPESQRVYGTQDQRIAKMQQAVSDIMQNGVQVSLIK